MNTSIKQWDKIIIGIDPGTTVMGYGILGIKSKTPQLIVMGVLKLNRYEDHYMRLHRIFTRVTSLVDEFLPDEMAIEAPFFGKNVQSMLITEYEPRKIKMAITGNGAASKEQVASMIQRTLHISNDHMPALLDATDALAAALCHFYESQKPVSSHRGGSWKSFIAQHPDRVKGLPKK